MNNKAYFFIDLKDDIKSINPFLSFANANLGYTLVQAIIEYIDNAIDAKASEIAICFEENKILIIDNGEGLEDVEEFFKVPIVPRKRKKQEIGLFSCGTFSAFSVADVCSFISRNGMDKSAKGISISYSQEYGGMENKRLDENKLRHWFLRNEKCGEIFKTWKSIVIIENIHTEKNSICLNDANDSLYARLGQRYLERIITKSICINIWDMQSQEDEVNYKSHSVEFVDPTFYNEKQKDIQSFHKGAFEFRISMKEIGQEMGETAVDRYYEKYISHYNVVMSREAFDAEELLVKYYVLKTAKKYEDFIEHNPRYKRYKPGGRSLSTGFYVYRNGIGIGDAAVDKKMTVDMKRQEYNRFKAIIESTPAFDELLGINVRKDDFEVVESLTRILEQKLQESIVSFFSSIPMGKKYKANKLGPCIVNLFKAVDALECEEGNETDKENKNDEKSEEKVQSKAIDVSQLKSVVQGILLYSSLITSDLKDKIQEWEKVIFKDEEEYRNVLAQANEILANLKLMDRYYLQDLDNMLRRVDENRSRRIVTSEKYLFLSDIDEPRNEQETVFFLLRILENVNHIKEAQKLELDKVFAYDTSNGIDFIGITVESDEEYKTHINSILECCTYLDAKKIYEKYKMLVDYRYSGVEIKAVINNGMVIGHSLATSRFLVAWKSTIGTDGCICADDGKYFKISENSGTYIYENSITKHRIKVIILKEWGTNNGVFEVKNKSNKL